MGKFVPFKKKGAMMNAAPKKAVKNHFEFAEKKTGKAPDPTPPRSVAEPKASSAKLSSMFKLK